MTVTLLEGHVVDVLAGLPANHWHVCVTSPPYLWLRSYGTEPLAWDGEPDCAHEWGAEERGKRGDLLPREQSSSESRMGLDDRQGFGPPSGGRFCTRCGAWRGELGQEPSVELFVEHLVAVFRAVRRVLRQDGTLWVNLAGCYFNDPGGQNGASLRNGEGASTLTGANLKNKAVSAISAKAVEANAALGRQKRGRHPWLKPLDWVDVPGLFARAMQQDGWTWRSDVVWVKPSALPESVSGTRFERCRVRLSQAQRSEQPAKVAGGGVRPQSGVLNGDAPGAEWADCPGCSRCDKTDGLVLRRGSGRPTKSTESVLLFVKGPGYFYDADAVRERPAEATIARLAQDVESQEGSWRANGGAKTNGPMRAVGDASGRNLRDWWVLSPEPLKLEHYAAYPSALPERCIKAGTSEWGCCPSCGAPWARVVESRFTATDAPGVTKGGQKGMAEENGWGQWPRGATESTTLGWRPTCRCRPDEEASEYQPVPCRVLDPFSGSGTTLLAANRLGRDATGVELKPAYNDLARKRVGREPLSLFAWHGQEALAAGDAPTPLETTKQEQHPTRTVRGFNQRWKASHGAGGLEEVPL